MTVSCGVQVLMAIVARCCLHTMYEFTAFMNMWAVEALGVSGGVAAQVGAMSITTLFTLILSAQRSVCLQHMLSSCLVLYHGPKAVAGHPCGGEGGCRWHSLATAQYNLPPGESLQHILGHVL